MRRLAKPLLLLVFVAFASGASVGSGVVWLGETGRPGAEAAMVTASGEPDAPPRVWASLRRPSSATIAKARRLLADLAVEAAGSMVGYDRDLFPHWSDLDGNGCDSRENTLVAEGTNVATGPGCRVTGGAWVDPYSGERFTDPQDVDIDHIVALGNAWRSGAARWTRTKRQRFANDPLNLLAVEDRLNRIKGDKRPEAWRPPLRRVWAAYSVRWIRIKSKYGLSVRSAEKRKLLAMVETR
jgi:hypothetical protein